MSIKKTTPTCITIFGGSGDLTKRKLIPALYNLWLDKWINEKFLVICTGRNEMSNDAFIKTLKEGVDEFSRRGKADAKEWERFSSYIQYKVADFTKEQFYDELKKIVQKFEKEAGEDAVVNKIYYMAVPPQFFEPIAKLLSKKELNTNKANSRLVIEKPFGTNLESAQELNNCLLSVFDECQLYRIDHYLGKETVQNLLAFRFANALFEPVWNRNFIDHIQITVAEQIGVEDRGNYYEGSGALRDMIQNHLLQLVCLIAMEPPVSFEADEIRNRKVDVLHAVRKISKDTVHDFSVRGQYGPGEINGKKVPGYRSEKNVAPDSGTETFAALKLYIDNWRWNGVPIYLRSGKRLHETFSSIIIEFKPVPHQPFPEEASETWQPNLMVMNLQPDMGIRLRFQAKKPGLQMQLAPVDMLFDYSDTYASTGTPEGYETLLLDVMEGDATLFMRADQVEAAWKIITPVLENWLSTDPASFPNYTAGSWGPQAADTLLTKDGNNWIIMPFKKNNHE